MENLSNTGVGLQPWFIYVQLAITIALIAVSIFAFKKYLQKKDEKGSPALPITMLIVTVTVVYFFFVAFGPGNVGNIQSTSSKEGSMKIQDSTKTIPVDSVKKKSDDNRPNALKRQNDEGFEKEKQEADDYLKQFN